MTTGHLRIRRRRLWASLIVFVGLGMAQPWGADRKFYDDDPLPREPETQNASKAKPWEVVLSYDLVQNLFGDVGDQRKVLALDVNSIDEVPDSSWFTNRILARPLSIDELVRGPQNGPGLAPGPIVVRPKTTGVTPGFSLSTDSQGGRWFLQFDAPGQLEAASGASMVGNKIFQALGYWQTENYLAEIRPEDVRPLATATVKTPSGKTRPFTRADIDAVFARAAKQPNGAYRVLASRALAGTPLGPFKYYGTRPDDPNDVIAHEHRRALRALQVFGAWTNLVDMKAGNTIDVLVNDNGRQVVRHYLQDVGSTFGTGALAPREWWEGHEYLFETSPTWKRLVTFGFYLQPWQTMSYEEYSSIGRFEGDRFEPAAWKPRVPGTAILNARPDDQFWAARRVMAFTDEMIRAIVKTGGYSDSAAEKHLGDVLIKRRDKIGQSFLPAINPIVDPVLGSDGVLRFANAAVDARVASQPAQYRAVFFRFDNVTSDVQAIGEVSGADARLQAPAGLPSAAGSYIRVEISAMADKYPSWAQPIKAYFRRTADAWKLVGLERLD